MGDKCWSVEIWISVIVIWGGGGGGGGVCFFFFFQAEDGIRDAQESRGLGDVYKRQPIIIAVINKELRDRLSAMNAKIMGANTDPFYNAPVVLIVLANKDTMPTYVYDGSLVMGNLMNAAHAYGISSCWIHRAKEEFESEEGKEILRSLGIEGNYEGIGHCILGYADCEAVSPSPRKDNYVYWAE